MKITLRVNKNVSDDDARKILNEVTESLDGVNFRFSFGSTMWFERSRKTSSPPHFILGDKSLLQIRRVSEMLKRRYPNCIVEPDWK